LASESGGSISDHVHAGAGTGGALNRTTTLMDSGTNLGNEMLLRVHVALFNDFTLLGEGGLYGKAMAVLG